MEILSCFVLYLCTKPTCLECGAILTNYSMVTNVLEQQQKSKHPPSLGKDREFSENKKKRHPDQLSDFVKTMNTTKSDTLTKLFGF